MTKRRTVAKSHLERVTENVIIDPHLGKDLLDVDMALKAQKQGRVVLDDPGVVQIHSLAAGQSNTIGKAALLRSSSLAVQKVVFVHIGVGAKRYGEFFLAHFWRWGHSMEVFPCPGDWARVPRRKG